MTIIPATHRDRIKITVYTVKTKKYPGISLWDIPGSIIYNYYFVSIRRISLLLCTNFVISSGARGLWLIIARS